MENLLDKSLKILQRSPKVLQAMLDDICEDLVHTNEGEHTWSAWEVVAHLLYMDKTNWLDRIKVILHEGTCKTFKNYDRHAQFISAKGKTIDDLIIEFTQIRQSNIRFLQNISLHPEILHSKTAYHPEYGEVNLAELLTTWTAHDLTHINQIARIMAKVYKDKVVLALLD